MYAYPWTAVHEGVRPMLSAISVRAGCDAVSVAFTYHHAKLLAPHGPRPTMHFADANGVYFRPTLSRYRDTGIQPNVSSLAIERDVLAEVRAQARQIGIALRAWIVCLHNSGQATRHPDAAQMTVYGDPLLFSLCPSHPDVREYVTQLIVDVAVTYEPDAIELESLEYLPFTHGHHHELTGVALDPYHEFLLGLDFNPHTRADMERRGVDVERVAEFVRGELDRFFAGGSECTGVGFDYLPHVLFAHPEVAAFLQARVAIVTELFDEVARAVRSVANTAVHAILSMWRPVHLAWAEGYSPSQLVEIVDRLGLPAYYPLGRIAPEVVHLRREIGDLSAVTALVDAGAPLVTSEAELAATTDLLRSLGINDLAFYNYSLVRSEVLDWIRHATRGRDRGSPA